ncbi:HAD family hydrolase [Nocardia otitidiscaviarum]|uniref:HAD family hydrolase n=1 Tax=Nocardia otitidiscaviarum TaxID=1823 RepID=UPI001894BD09|nr:HAD family phosphatase [Nocardia otitidiscaviarum]MBF6179984.1 HAD family phosphatase [Nocardia otitidiscaviarum]
MSMVYLDFGGVLSPPIAELFEAYERKTGIAPAALQWAMARVAADLGVAPLAPIELAMLPETEWVDRLHAALRERDPAVDLSRSEREFGAQWFAGHDVNPRVRQLVFDLRARGHRVGILTNNVVEWEPVWRRMVDLDDAVDHIVDSCRVGVRKPDPAIFDLARERAGVPAEECVLVDDLAENCAAAIAAGWRAVRFVDAAQAIAELNARLDEPSPLSAAVTGERA